MTGPSLPPGFRFYPTDEELIVHYLRNRAASLPCPVSIIAEVDVYKFDPWDLPAKATFGEREWYFFSPRDRKYPNGVRPNRAAASGYWKATGTDKQISASGGWRENIGVKKGLVFYKGKAPMGQKTNWIMHEYRLAESQNKCRNRPLRLKESSMRLDDWVLCRIYEKSNRAAHAAEPALDQEQKHSSVEDFSSTNLKLENSFSLSDLLNHVDYSTLSQLLDMERGSQAFPREINQATKCSSSGNFSLQQFVQTESSVSKRGRPAIDGYLAETGVHFRPAKKNFTSQFLGTQGNLLSQPLLNQLLLLNPQLGYGE